MENARDTNAKRITTSKFLINAFMEDQSVPFVIEFAITLFLISAHKKNVLLSMMNQYKKWNAHF